MELSKEIKKRKYDTPAHEARGLSEGRKAEGTRSRGPSSRSTSRSPLAPPPQTRAWTRGRGPSQPRLSIPQFFSPTLGPISSFLHFFSERPGPRIIQQRHPGRRGIIHPRIQPPALRLHPDPHPPQSAFMNSPRWQSGGTGFILVHLAALFDNQGLSPLFLGDREGRPSSWQSAFTPFPHRLETPALY